MLIKVISSKKGDLSLDPIPSGEEIKIKKTYSQEEKDFFESKRLEALAIVGIKR